MSDELLNFTMRQEANAITCYAFRNGFIEDLHSGKSSPLLGDPALSRITDDEMRTLMIECSRKVAHLLWLRAHDPIEYLRLILHQHLEYCGHWSTDGDPREKPPQSAQRPRPEA